MIGIIIAMPQELKPYSSHIKRVDTFFGKEFHFGKIGEQKIVICLSGIGKVNAAFATTLIIEKFKPKLIINTGVSGGLGRLKPLDLVIADKVVQHDVDTTPLGDPKGMVSTINKIYFQTSENFNNEMLKYLNNAHVGTLACGDQFIADKELSQKIVDNFDAIACDMESGAVAQVAYLAGTNYVIIRGISDGADEGAAMDFLQMVNEMSKNIYNAVKTFIEKL